MKIQNISTPVVMGYYNSKDTIEQITHLIEGEPCHESNGKLFITLDFNTIIEESFRLYKSKTEKVTARNCYKYEYELDIPEVKDDKVFIIRTEDGKFYKCDLEASYVTDHTIIAEFGIIK